MRITIDTRLLTRGGTTGIPGYTRDLITTLSRRHPEHQYTLFYNAFLGKNPLPLTWQTNPHLTIASHSLPNKLLDLSIRTLHWPPLEKFAPADLIFSPHFNLLAKTRTPRVITFHDLSFLHYPEFYQPRKRLWHWLQQCAAQAAAADHLIAVSKFTKSDLINFFKIPEEKITVVYSGVGSEFKPITPNNPHLSKYRVVNRLNIPFILSLSTLEPRKNILQLIGAFELLKQRQAFKDHELILAGRPGYQSEAIARAVKQSPYAKSIRFFPLVEDKDRVYLYNSARVFVFPSFFEGFGFPPLEAQACGVPVVAADRASLPEILGETALLTDPWHTGELADAIDAIETNSKLRENKITAGLTNAQRFPWSAAADSTAAIFEKVYETSHALRT